LCPAEIGEFGSFEIAPDLLDRIEVGGVGRKPLDHQPVALALEEGLHLVAPVRRESVPDQGDLVAVEVAVQFGQKVHDRFAVVRARLHAKDE
jgi:hypothetical protein